MATFDIADRVTASPIFRLLDHLDEGLLLIHDLIPTDLTSLFYNYISPQSSRDPLLLKYVADFIRDLQLVTWRKRTNHSFKQWERSLNITRKDKLYYRSRFRDADTPTSRRNSRRENERSSTRAPRSQYATLNVSQFRQQIKRVF
ncbi:3618_t:CDS:2 [Rhizophagus irregularis]|nr:3618_t:CDS:2 [Rhizophagus irregularis]